MEKILPRWQEWFALQSDEVRAAVETKWQETATDPDIAHWHQNAEYARSAKLLDYCREAHGYDG